MAGDDGHSVAEKAEQPPILRQFKDGFVYLREHRLGRALVTMEIFEHIPHGIWSAALLLVFVESALNGDTTDWGNFNASFFFGLLGGSIIATMLTKAIARRPGWFIILNAFLSAALTWAFAVSGNILFAIIVAMAFGVPFALRDVAQNSLLQANVDNKMLGRVFALRETGLSVMFMFSSLFFAALADFVEIRTIYLIGAVLYLGTTIYALGNKALRESRIEDDNRGE
ncbi:MAG: MFS transporter [Methylococcales bacterium]|nr:MFS transporter [Methylococcales bacterium]